MSTCKEISALATDHAEGNLGAADRGRFEEHVATCPACSAWAEQLEATARVLRALPAPELPLAQRQVLLSRFDAWALRRKGGARRSLAPALAALGVFGLLAATARHPSAAPTDWALALGLAGAAAALVVVRPRLTFGSAAGAVALALAAAVLAGGRGPLELEDAHHCLLSVGAAASGGAGLAWLVLRRPEERSSAAVGAWAVAGALAGVGALQVSCSAHGSFAHLLVVHAGSLAAVAAFALVASRHAIVDPARR